MGKIYRIAVGEIPSVIDPYRSIYAINGVVAMQLYTPMFQISPSGDLASVYLDLQKSRAEDATFRKFSFCLKSNIHFSDGSPIEADDLLNSLKQSHEFNHDLPPIVSSDISDRCVSVVLERPDPDYFYRLTTIQSAITKENNSDNKLGPIGFGKYKIEEKTAQHLIMTSVPDAFHGDFDKLEFLIVKSMDEGRKAGVMDWNHYPSTNLSPQEIASLTEIRRPVTNSLMVFVKVKDESLRKRIASCLPIEKIRSAVNWFELTDIPALLPRGVLGWDASAAELQACSPVEDSDKLSLPFYIHKADRVAPFQQVFDSAKDFPVRIKSEFVDGGTLPHKHSNPNEEYISIIFVASMGWAPSSFFNRFIGPERMILPVPVDGLSEQVKSISTTFEPEARRQIIGKCQSMLLESGYLAPLGQIVMKRYYQKNVGNINWFERSDGVPDFGSFKDQR